MILLRMSTSALRARNSPTPAQRPAPLVTGIHCGYIVVVIVQVALFVTSAHVLLAAAPSRSADMNH